MSSEAKPIDSTDLESSAGDDGPTVCAISVLAAMIADVLHEGVGHATLALVTGAQSGVLSTVAWSSPFDSRLVAAGGTLVNLVAGGLFWWALRRAGNASAATRFFLLMAVAFNLFDGTGYFFFSGVTNFGDWAQVIASARPHLLWRTALVAVGVLAYYAAVLLVGVGFVRKFGISADNARMRKLTILPYVSAIVLVGVSGIFNPIGMRLVWQSALPATAGAYSGLLWFRYYIPKKMPPARNAELIRRNYAWITVGTILAVVFIVVLGRGITISLNP
jgi:hypothetical protein